MFGMVILQEMWKGKEDSQQAYQRELDQNIENMTMAAKHNDVAAIRVMANMALSMQFTVYQLGMLTAIENRSTEVIALLLKKMGSVNLQVLNRAKEYGILDQVFYRADESAKQQFMDSLAIGERVHVRRNFELQ